VLISFKWIGFRDIWFLTYSYCSMLRKSRFSYNQTNCWALYVVGRNMKYSVAQKQCKGNPLLHFHGNTQQFYIVSWLLCITKGMHCWAVTSVDSDMQPNITQDAGCFSAVTVVTQTHHAVVLYIHCPSCHQYSIRLTIYICIYKHTHTHSLNPINT